MESLKQSNRFNDLPFMGGDRALSEDGGGNSYLVDADGNEYEPYSLAWRYLGMYIDCDIEEEEYDDDEEEEYDEEDGVDRRRRKTLQQQKKRHLSSNDNGDDCSRKVLWAAYYDPRYKGGSIGEYQFYDWVTGEWDDSTCQGGRCARMDCHEDHTHFKLVGVFKETDGLYDWAEQLFKHQGYCLWNADKDSGSGSGDSNDEYSSDDYEFMQDEYADWINYFGCQQMSLTDSDGNTLYVDARPQGEGNFTYGLYTDDDCTELSEMTWSDYIVMWYQKYYYYYNNGNFDAYEIASSHETSVERWNTLMNDYKTCQPCRAYNRIVVEDDEDGNGDNGSEEDDEGYGAAEQWGYNCYDDAGYRNCNQCHKFMSKTDLEPASTQDLERASAQGTILRIKVEGVRYGSGGFHSPADPRVTYVVVGLATVAILALIIFNFKFVSKWTRKLCQACGRCVRRFVAFIRNRVFAQGVREAFLDKEKELWEVEEELHKKRQLIEEQESEMNLMQAQLEHERMLRTRSQLSDDDATASVSTEGAGSLPNTPERKTGTQKGSSPQRSKSPPASLSAKQSPAVKVSSSPTASPKRSRSQLPSPARQRSEEKVASPLARTSSLTRVRSLFSSPGRQRSSEAANVSSPPRSPRTSFQRVRSWTLSPGRQRMEQTAPIPEQSEQNNTTSTTAAGESESVPADDKEIC